MIPKSCASLTVTFSGIEAGQPADPYRLLARLITPTLASQLRAYLDVMQVAGRMAEDPNASTCTRRLGHSDNLEPRF